MAEEEDYNVLGEDSEIIDPVDVLGEGQDEAVSSKENPLAALLKHHPECVLDYAESVAPKLSLTASPPMRKDKNHRSVPFLTQYEKTKIIGMRANQLSQGARLYIPKPPHVTDVCELARLELAARRLPFIVRRPMPDGTHEYWRLSDLILF